MTHIDLTTLLDFHYWARDRMLGALEPLTAEQYSREVGGSFGSIRATVVHVYLAEWAWFERWNGRSPAGPLTTDTLPDPASLGLAWRTLETSVRAFIAAQGAGGLDRVIEYRLLSRQSGASVLWHMVQHVVNHATYHRGQVTTLLRQVDATPPPGTDLITFYRERRPVA